MLPSDVSVFGAQLKVRLHPALAFRKTHSCKSVVQQPFSSVIDPVCVLWWRTGHAAYRNKPASEAAGLSKINEVSLFHLRCAWYSHTFLKIFWMFETINSFKKRLMPTYILNYKTPKSLNLWYTTGGWKLRLTLIKLHQPSNSTLALMHIWFSYKSSGQNTARKWWTLPLTIRAALHRSNNWV